jgi:hypothetical protein
MNPEKREIWYFFFPSAKIGEIKILQGAYLPIKRREQRSAFKRAKRQDSNGDVPISLNDDSSESNIDNPKPVVF